MSDTDDTDVLLLIPPDFFLVRSSGSEDSLLDSSRTVVHKPISCTAQVIGKLVDQVQTLECRLENLELSTTCESGLSICTLPRTSHSGTDSVDDRSLYRKSFTFPRRRRKKFNKKERLYDTSLTSLESLKSTCYTKIPTLSLNSEDSKLTNTVNDMSNMDGDISSIVSTPSKKNDKLLLHEIDDFLTKVEAYETPDKNFNDQEIAPHTVIQATGDYISQKLDSGRTTDHNNMNSNNLPSRILDRYIYLANNKSSDTQTDDSIAPPSYTKSKSLHDSQNLSSNIAKESQELSRSSMKSPTVKKINFNENNDVQPTSTPKKPECSRNYVHSFKPSSNKIYDRASKVLEQYKAQNYSSGIQSSESNYMTSPNKEEFKLPQMRPYMHNDNKENFKLQSKLLESIDVDLLSLSDLWGHKEEKHDSNKLEEERLKREHCEAMIQELQKKLLEQQEKLAVALKVDRAKDIAISKLKEAWIKVTSGLERTEKRHKNDIEKMAQEVERYKAEADKAQKKTSHFETELYKALDLAHVFQEKCKELAANRQEQQSNKEKCLAERDEIIMAKDKEIILLKENYEAVMRMNKQSTECVKNLEEALEKEKLEHEQTKSKLTDFNDRLESVKEEMSMLVQERDTLKFKVNEERARCNMIDRQLSDKQDMYSEMMKKCENLEAEVKSLQKHFEIQRNELKLHYQKQLETAVLSKLQEFQHQLETAEREIENDARCKESALVDSFEKQMNRIEEQHRLEINVMEEKHKEEIKLYRLQLAQAGEKNAILESKLESYRRRRTQIASQLHGVMETQWRQALQILTQTGQSSLDGTRSDNVPTPIGKDYKMPQMSLPNFERVSHSNPSRATDAMQFEPLSDNELQQYVKRLLTKPPNFDGSGDTEKNDFHEEPTSDKPDKERKDRTRRSLNKPPWKA